MKKYIKYLLIVFAIAALHSCYKEYLDPVPKDRISDLTAFDTKDRIVGQVHGLYASVKSGQYLGGRYQVYNDIRADDFLNLRTNGVTGYQTWSLVMAPSTNEVQNLWEQVYAAINRVNVFLEGMENKRADIVPLLLTQEEYNQFIGEALALRGMAFFHLSQLYAKPYNMDQNALGLVLRITAQRNAEGNDKARSTVRETYDQILSDLTTAAGLLPLSHGSALLDLTRMQRNTVNALLTRVYLHMNDFSKVLEVGNQIVSASAPFSNPGGGQAYALAPTFAAVFAPPYTSSESIFSIPMTPAELPGTQNQLGYYFSVPPAGNEEYPINEASPLWTNMTDFPATDARRLLTREANNATYINKFPTFPHTDYAPVIRYAEILLNVAEAEARVNGVNARAVALLNAVHGRSDDTRVYTVGEFANADAFVAQLLKERNMEFLGEGLRNMDIMRMVAPIPAKANVAAMQPNGTAYIWPIAQNEMNFNNLAVQN
jgi:starch-binding outer membrane protein, SusD/RagB family